MFWLIVAGFWTFAVAFVGGAIIIRTFQIRGNRRAYHLLRSHLNRTQLWEFDTRHSFEVVGSDGNRYRLRPQFAYSVSSRGVTYCAYPRGVPIYDAMLAQKLLLETNAYEFKTIAYQKSRRK